jgi:uncharacterized protein (DUF1697 family)
MTAFIALLRAVNVGGTGKLAMADLTTLCEAAGFKNVKTYIASGNVVFQSDQTEGQVKSTLEDALRSHTGKSIGVIVRTAAEIADVLARNPFATEPGNRVAVLFTDDPLPVDPLHGVTGAKNEDIRSGKRELFIHYTDGMATTRLRLPAEMNGTARNMNSVSKLAEMTAALA